MKQELTCRMKPYIQPFEKHLALLELRTLAGSEPRPTNGAGAVVTEYAVLSRLPAPTLAKRLAYWEIVGPMTPTIQALREATANVVRNGIELREIREKLPLTDADSLPGRRVLRYGPHGLHEYRGKFFPQLVRALCNIADLPAKALVADPMCGSGTALVEAVLGGYRGLGADLNPLSVLMTETKCQLLKVEPRALIGAYKRVRASLARTRSGDRDLPYFRSLPAADQLYLMRWFSPKALRDLDVVMQYILRERPPALRNLMRLSVSNILRRVSWQKEDDLRVRREVRDTEPDVFGEFADELLRAVRLVLALRYQEGARKLGGARVTDVDARQLDSRWRAWRRSVDAVVTSPPYATALPYLDTDRLSLSYLGLLPRSMHRRQDQLMIGNREITEKTRRLYWERYETEKSQLPERVTDLIAAIDTLNRASNVGFRRRNLSALLGKYFLDMRTVLRGIHGLLKPSAHAFVVVGDNHTVAGGRRVEIKTAQLLADVAGSVGFRVDDLVPMEMLVSRDIFRRNAVGSEWIVCLRR